MQTILSKAPFHFKRWMIILQRWEPIVSDYFPALISFWIRVHGIPLHYWTDIALNTIGEELKPVENFDVDRGRVRVQINGLKPLEMKMDISLPSGEIKQVDLEYEKLERHCFACYSLSHEADDCPSQQARNNAGNSRYPSLGINQSRTLERLEAHRARTQTMKNSRTIPSLPSHKETRPQRWNRVSEPSAFDWNREKEFRVNYGARKELSSREGSSRIDPKGPSISRTPAREHLCFRRDSSEVHRGSVSNNVTSTPRQTWRPVAEGSRKGNSASQGMSQVSHTPSPRPQREEDSLQRAITNRENQNSGNGSARSSQRRSAHDRLSLPSPRIPLLQDGVANSESGRLQEVPIQVLEDNSPLLSSGGLPSSSRKPSTPSGEARNSFLNRSPIRTLSEDRLHVSLRLGPIADNDPENTSQLQLNRRSGKEVASQPNSAGKRKQITLSQSKMKGSLSPNQGVSVKKRRVTKVQNSPRRRTVPATGQSSGATRGSTRGTQPRTTLIPAAPKPLP